MLKKCDDGKLGRMHKGIDTSPMTVEGFCNCNYMVPKCIGYKRLKNECLYDLMCMSLEQVVIGLSRPNNCFL